ISYITFKVLQILIETYDGVIKEFKLFETIAFLLFFAPLSAGPIDRSRRFAEDFNKRITRGDYLELFGSGLKKLMLGLCYKFVVAELLSGWLIAFIGKFDPLSLLAYIYLYGLNLFFDFAGYSLMAVGLSYMFAIRTPDNFKLPFISIDIKDFWNRWHITLSHWFRDFVFSRLMMSILRKKLFTSRLTGASIAMITNMALMGIWHGVSVSYIMYGIYHGVLIAATEIYQKKSRFHHRYKNTRPYRLLSWFVTMNAVFLGFFIFSGEFIGLIGAVLGFPIS
ncbi:MAG: D-alanyl-lipoteichoic acid biosynthesis protein DltB, partial [Coriobacteriaceae bacterium]|nr:D-alanyl-lipoteichoic acid biosynthesis protein DltB [Coriobacteriaceae bacterium]